MRALIIGDRPALVAQIRAMVNRCDYECRDADQAPLKSGAEYAARARHDLVVLVMTTDPAGSLSTLRDIRHVTPADILAVGPASDARLVLRALREGADEYVADEDLETDLENTLLQRKTKRSPKNENGRVVAVMAPSGGSGASTLSANLAAALAKSHGAVALAEIPNGQGDQQLLLDLQPVHTLADLCRHLHRLDHSMFAQSLAMHSTGVRLLAAAGGNSSAAAITPQGIRQALAFSRAAFPFVVVDVDRVLARQQVAALVQADLILLVLRLDLMSLNNTRRMLNQLDQLGLAESAINVVVNRFRQPKELSYRRVEQALGLKLFHFVINDPAALNMGTSKGVPTVVDSPRSKYSRSIVTLAQRVDEFCRSQQTHTRLPQELAVADPSANGTSRLRGAGMLLPPLTAGAAVPVVEEDCSN